MMNRIDIVEAIAKGKLVEDIVSKVARSPLNSDLKDLAQMVYLILMETDETRLQDLWEHNQIKFYIARIVINQYNSSNSPFHYLYRKYQQMSVAVKDFKFLDNGEHPLASGTSTYYQDDGEDNE